MFSYLGKISQVFIISDLFNKCVLKISLHMQKITYFLLSSLNTCQLVMLSGMEGLKRNSSEKE